MQSVPRSAGIKEVGLFEFEQGGIIFVELLQDLSHDDLSHELGFIPDLVLLTIEV